MRKTIVAGLAVVVAFAVGGIVYYMQSVDKPGVADPNDAKQVALGNTVYAKACAECHGANLEGEANWREPKEDGKLPAPPHDPSGHTWHHGDFLLFKYTKHGGASIAPKGFKSGMPGFADNLSDEEIWAVLAYIKSNWSEKELKRQQKITEQEKKNG